MRSRFSSIGRGQRAELGGVVSGARGSANCAQTVRNRCRMPQTPEQTPQIRAYYCSYVLRFSALERDEGAPSLFLKIVFDKGGAAAY
jgi:hypothetical protein